MSISTFDTLLEEGMAQSLNGWDFSWLNARTHEEGLPWDYRAIALERMRGARSLLDIGTGGGEFLAALAPFPPVTWATEGYPPNVPVARARLEPLGVQVADLSGLDMPQLPFADGTFELIIDRHEGFPTDELYRVLQPGGRYVTQQVGGQNCLEMNYFLEDTPTALYAGSTLAGNVQVLEETGLRILEAREAFPRWTFTDVAGIVFYLKVIPWQIRDFTVERFRDRLYQIHLIIEKEGGWTVHQHRWLIEADRP